MQENYFYNLVSVSYDCRKWAQQADMVPNNKRTFRLAGNVSLSYSSPRHKDSKTQYSINTGKPRNVYVPLISLIQTRS